MIVPVVGRIRAEERLRQAEFGHEFETYPGRTWRLVPGVHGLATGINRPLSFITQFRLRDV
jgi:hypothetical protein